MHRDLRNLHVPGSLLGVVLWALAHPGAGFEPYQHGPLTAHVTLNTRLGFQYGSGINFGLGALDDDAESERSSFAASIEPKLELSWALSESLLYGGISVAAATTALDGEMSGQFARAGDDAIDTDEAHVGWRNALLDFAFGAQEFSVGDGLLIGDGNLDTGGEEGQYWVVPFQAWRNAAVLKVNTGPLRGDVFWLRSDRDFGDARVVGVNLETSAHAVPGTLGVMYMEILEGNRLNYDGMNVWDLRASDIKIPGIANLLIFGEFVRQAGTDADRRTANDAIGWYLEAQYVFPALPGTPTFTYRYARFSGDELDTRQNEEYRGLFYGFYGREWDTWYQGEIAGEYHLFNQNQISQMVKFEVVPRPNWVLTFYYYHHDLEEPQFLGTPLASTRWADEINLGVEYFLGERFYGYAGALWSAPDDAAQQFFGEDQDFVILQTWLSYTF